MSEEIDPTTIGQQQAEMALFALEKADKDGMAVEVHVPTPVTSGTIDIGSQQEQMGEAASH